MIRMENPLMGIDSVVGVHGLANADPIWAVDLSSPSVHGSSPMITSSWTGVLAAVAMILVGAREAIIASEATGFYRVEKRAGVWWLMDPAGKPTLSKGVCHIQFKGDTIGNTGKAPYGEANQAKYGSAEAWRTAAAGRLLEWGFNSLGAWSDPALSSVQVQGKRLADAPILDFGSQFVSARSKGEQAWLHGIFPDVFDPGFAAFCDKLANERCLARRDDPGILGWFTDNELRWGPDWRGTDELLTLFLNQPPTTPGRKAAIQLLRGRYSEVKQFNTVWKTAFSTWAELEQASKVTPPYTRKAIYAQNEGEERSANDADPQRAAFVADCDAFLAPLAENYFKFTRDALRKVDRHHLNFGCRFAYVPPKPVREAAARYLDVISFNCYQTDPTSTVKQYAVFGLPLIIGEFTFRADDVGLPNTKGAGPRVANQAERAQAFERYARLLLQQPEVIGYHWFQHNDQPKEGRFDGENSNYGVVNERDETYLELTRRMTTVNAIAPAWHATVGPASFVEPFRDQLSEGWSWVREDKSAWRIGQTGLEIRLQPGNMWGPPNNARNILVRPVPDPANQDVIASVAMENQPTGQYEQVDLVWYYDDSNMVKLGQELVDGKLSVVMGREEKDRTRTIAIIPLDSYTLQVRFLVRGNQLTGEYKPGNTTEWKTAGSCDLPVNGAPKISLQCYQGLATVERWAKLAGFQVHTLAR